MQLMTAFKQHFPEFPMINAIDAEKFYMFCQESLNNSRRLQRIPQKLLKIEDSLSIQQAPLFEALIPLIPHDVNFHFFQLLLQDSCQLCFNTEILISQLWCAYLQEYLSAPHALEALTIAKNLIVQPSQIAGLLIAMMQCHYSVTQILESGLFQDFFIRNSFDFSKIETTCAILRKRQTESPLIELFLNRLNEISCGLDLYPLMALDASIKIEKPENLGITTISQAFEFPQQLFKQFMDIFGGEFLSDIIFSQLSVNSHDLLQSWLASQTPTKISSFYTHLLLSTHHQKLIDVFKIIFSLTPKAMISQLLEHDTRLFWPIVAICPESLKKTKAEIIEEILKQPINEKNQWFVAEVCKNRKYESVKEKLYGALFILQFSLLQSEEESSIIVDLYHYKKTRHWCETYSRKMVKDLKEIIESSCVHFTIDDFININDFFHLKRRDLNQLRSFGYEQSEYPKDCYDFCAMVLTCLFQSQTNKDLMQWLNIMSYFHQGNPDFQREYQLKILETWFDFTHSIDIRTFIYTHLFLSFQQDVKKLSKQKRFDLAEAAYQSPFSLSCFLQLYPSEEKKLKALTCKIKKHQVPLSIFSLTRPDYFQIIIEALQSETLVNFLSGFFHKQEPLWFHAPLRECYRTIQKKCSLIQRTFLLTQKNSKDANIIELNLDKPDFIQQIMDDYGKIDVCYWDKISFSYLENLYYQALNHPETFNLLFNSMSDHTQIEILLRKNKEHNLLEMIIPNREILKNILTQLDYHTKRFVYRLYAKEILIEHRHDLDILNLIFKQIPSLSLLNIVLQPVEHQYRFLMIDLLIQTPGVLCEILQKLKSYQRKILFNIHQKALINHLCKQKNSDFILSFEYLPSEELYGFIESDEFFHFILCDANALSSYLENLSTQDIQGFLSHQNSKGENWLLAAPIHHLTLDMILSYSPNPENLINHTLICKSINQPECLKVILDYIPIEKRGDWILSLEKIYLQNLINLESLIYLIAKIPENQQASLLIIKHQRHQSTFQWLLHEFNALIKLMPHLTQESKTLLNHKIIQHTQELQSFKKFPEKIKSLLEYFNPLEKFKFLLALCQEFSDDAITPLIKLEIMKFAISSLDHIDSLSPRQFSNEQKKNPMWYHIKHSRFFKDCVPHLITRGQELDLCQFQNI